MYMIIFLIYKNVYFMFVFVVFIYTNLKKNGAL